MPLPGFTIETAPYGARWEISEGFCEGVIPVTGPVCVVYDLYLIWTPEIAASRNCVSHPGALGEPV